MDSNISQNTQSRKRCSLVNSSMPSKRLKCTLSDNTISKPAMEANEEELHRIYRQSKEYCNKRLIELNGVAYRLKELGGDILCSVDVYDASVVEQSAVTIEFIEAKELHLKKLTETVLKSLQIATNKFDDEDTIPPRRSVSQPHRSEESQDQRNHTVSEDNASSTILEEPELHDSNSNHSNLSEKTVCNVIINEDLNISDAASQDAFKSRLCEKTGIFIDKDSDIESDNSFSLLEMGDPFIDSDLEDYMEIESEILRLCEKSSCFTESDIESVITKLCEKTGRFIEANDDISQSSSDTESEVLGHISHASSETEFEVYGRISQASSDTNSYVFDISTPISDECYNEEDRISDTNKEPVEDDNLCSEAISVLNDLEAHVNSKTLDEVATDTNTSIDENVKMNLPEASDQIHIDMSEHDDTFYEYEAENPIATDEELMRIKDEREVILLHTDVNLEDKELLKEKLELESQFSEINKDPNVEEVAVKINESNTPMDCNDDLLQDVTIGTNEEEQSAFLCNFGLKGNEELKVEENNDEEDINAVLNTLKTTNDHLFDVSRSLSSLSSDDYMNNSDDDMEVDVWEVGRIENRLPSLPPSASDSDVEEIVSPVVELKECKVLLQRLNMDKFNKFMDSKESHSKTSELKDDLNEINRLTNLAALDTVKTGTTTTANHIKNKYGKLSTKPNNSHSAEDDYTDDDIELMDTAIGGNMTPIDNHLELNNEQLRTLYHMDDNTEEEEEQEDTNKNQKKMSSNNVNDSDKENKVNGINKELTAEEMEKQKWKRDPLLRRILTDSDTDSESEAANKTKKKRLQSKCQTSDDEKTDKEAVSNDNHILIESDSYDSEIEFVSEFKRKKSTINRECRPKSSLDNFSSDRSSSDDSADEENSGTTKGRKNIREILSEEHLAEATKKAAQIENKRKERLSQKQKVMDSFLSQSSLDSQCTGLVLDVDDVTGKPIIVVHPKLTKRLKNHQQQGVRFMWESCFECVKRLTEDEGSGCILAHCMGLGKTFQVVTLIHTLFAHSITNTRHVLVICPLSIVFNWKTEFETGLRHLNDGVKINIVCLSGDSSRSVQQRAVLVRKWRQQGGVLVMGYEAFQCLTKFMETGDQEHKQLQLKKALVDPGPDLVVLDEGHLLKNGKIKRTRSLMEIKTKRRIVLTGTPLQNNLKEYYYMVQFVKPNLLGSYLEYTNRFVNPITNGQFGNSTADDINKMKMRSHVLHKMLRATIQRFEAAELQNYLLPRYDYALFIKVHSVQIELYTAYLEIIKRENKLDIFSHYYALQCILTHPYLLHLSEKRGKTKKTTKEIEIAPLDVEPDKVEIDGNSSTSGDWWKALRTPESLDNVDFGQKFKVMLTIIRKSEKVNDKVLIFTSALSALDAIEHFLQQNETETSKWRPKEDYYRMDGDVPPETRLQLCDSFNNKKNKRTRLFLVSHKVGGLGLNLVAANRVILMDVSWNPAVDNQSVFRSYRFGQEKKCYVYRLVSMGTMEHAVYERQVAKSALARRVVDEQQIKRLYRKEELGDLYRTDFDVYNQKGDPHVLPEDPVLKHVLSKHEEVFKYHEHNALLENRPDEELDEHQRKLAWEEYHKEQELNELEQQKKKASAATAASINTAIAVFSTNVTATSVSIAGSANAATTSNAQSATTTDVVHSFLPSSLKQTGKNSAINPVATFSERNFSPAFNDLIRNTRMPPPKSNVPMTASTNTTNGSSELQQNFSEWNKNNQIVMPKIVYVTGALQQTNNKSVGLPSTPANISTLINNIASSNIGTSSPSAISTLITNRVDSNTVPSSTLFNNRSANINIVASSTSVNSKTLMNNRIAPNIVAQNMLNKRKLPNTSLLANNRTVGSTTMSNNKIASNVFAPSTSVQVNSRIVATPSTSRNTAATVNVPVKNISHLNTKGTTQIQLDRTNNFSNILTKVKQLTQPKSTNASLVTHNPSVDSTVLQSASATNNNIEPSSTRNLGYTIAAHQLPPTKKVGSRAPRNNTKLSEAKPLARSNNIVQNFFKNGSSSNHLTYQNRGQNIQKQPALISSLSNNLNVEFLTVGNRNYINRTSDGRTPPSGTNLPAVTLTNVTHRKLPTNKSDIIEID